MSLKFRHTICVERRLERQSAPKKILAQVDYLKERALSGGRSERGWSCEIEPLHPGILTKGRIYRFALNFSCVPKTEKTQEKINKELDNIAHVIQSAGNSAGWKIITIDNKPYHPKKLITEEGQEIIPYADCEIPADWGKYYSEIYDLNAQIYLIRSRIQAAIDSDWENRYPCALVGEPSGGKTETARATKRMLGDYAVLELDATATTHAGVVKELKNRTELPRIIIIEEIEKCNFKELPWLLAMLDPRAEIRKLNYRHKVLLEMKALCIATINNYKLFKTVLEGSLASRFGEPIFFPRPTEEIMRKVLEREVQKVKGNMKWIKYTMEYCKEVNIFDPRTAQSICLSGKDDLLNGKYQDLLRQTRIPENYTS